MGVYVAEQDNDKLLSELLISTFSNLYASMGVEMLEERRAYLCDQSGRRSFATTLIYEANGEAAGTITVVPPSSHSEAWIKGAWDFRLLAVDPRLQGHGIARLLLKEAEQRVKRAGATVICLTARRGVPAQARLYTSCGYTRDVAGDIDRQPFQEGYRKHL